MEFEVSWWVYSLGRVDVSSARLRVPLSRSRSLFVIVNKHVRSLTHTDLEGF